MLIRLFTLVVVLTLATNLSAKTFTVSHRMSIKTISEALELAVDSDSIEVLAGTYYERSIIITKSIIIFTNENAKIDAEGFAEDIFIVRANNVKIIGFHLLNVGVSYLKEASAIRLVHCEDAQIMNNSISSCFFGVYVENSKNSTVYNNKIAGNFEDEASAGNAIHVWKGDNLVISHNVTSGHRDGIYFEFVNNSKIEDNKSHLNLRYGLHFMFSNNDKYENNLFQDNGAGVAVMFSNHISMLNNHFIHNWGGASYGLLLKEISDGRIEGNHFIENTVGILAEGANRLIISKNVFKLNGTALNVKGNCLDNEFHQNNFIANTFEVVTNSKQNNNLFSENYWSNYSGYDLDRNGFGDIAYRPVNLFAKVIHQVPSATFLLHSPFIQLIEIAEKIFPQYISKSLLDEHPRIKPYSYD
ncbi:nitrous oxide reductase family maturation protein NosD [Fulvivirgaceae bacterium LMO-SS25]